MLEDLTKIGGLGHSRRPGGGSRAFCDRMNSWAQGEGQPGLGYIMWRGEIEGVLNSSNEDERRVRDQVEELRKQNHVIEAIKVLEEWQAKNPGKTLGAEKAISGAGPLANNIGPERTMAIRAQLGLKEGDAAFFVAGDPDKFCKFCRSCATKVGEELNLIDSDRFELAWVVDFPMYE